MQILEARYCFIKSPVGLLIEQAVFFWARKMSMCNLSSYINSRRSQSSLTSKRITPPKKKGICMVGM